MKGLEMMLANLIGMKPEQMREQVDQALNLMRTGASAAARMQADLDAIKKHLGIDIVSPEVMENGRTAISDNRNNGSRIEL